MGSTSRLKEDERSALQRSQASRTEHRVIPAVLLYTAARIPCLFPGTARRKDGSLVRRHRIPPTGMQPGRVR